MGHQNRGPESAKSEFHQVDIGRGSIIFQVYVQAAIWPNWEFCR